MSCRHSASGSTLSVAVNVAYPIGDLVLLALAVGALVVVPGTPARLLTFAIGCGVYRSTLGQLGKPPASVASSAAGRAERIPGGRAAPLGLAA